MERQRIELWTSRMQSERSTTELQPRRIDASYGQIIGSTLITGEDGIDISNDLNNYILSSKNTFFLQLVL